MATLAAVVNEAPQPMRQAGPLAPLLAALLAKDPQARPSGPKVRAWLAWLLVRDTINSPHPDPPDPTTGSRPPPPSPPSTQPRMCPSLPGRGPSRSEEVPAFEQHQRPAMEPGGTSTGPAGIPPDSSAGPTRGPPDRRRLVGVAALLLAGGMLTAWLTGAVPVPILPGTGRPRPPPAAPGWPQARIRRPGPRPGAAPVHQRTTEPAPRPPRSLPAPERPRPPTAGHKTGLPAGWRPSPTGPATTASASPPGFRARTRQSYNATVIEEPRDPRRVFTVRSQSPSALLPQASRDYRAWARRNVTGFREVRYEEDQTYAGRKGAVVFEYQAVREGRGSTSATSTSRAGAGATTSSSSSRPSGGRPPRTWPASSSRRSSRSADRPHCQLGGHRPGSLGSSRARHNQPREVRLPATRHGRHSTSIGGSETG